MRIRSRLVLLCVLHSFAAVAQTQGPSGADTLRIMAAAGQWRSMPLDMSDPVHERFYLGQLSQAGIDERRAPEVYRRITAARTAARSRSGAAPAAVSGGMAIVDLSTSNQQTFTANAFGAAPGATTMVLTLSIVNAQGQPIGAVERSDVYATPYTTVSASGQLLEKPTGPVPVSAVLTWFWQDANGTPNFGTQTITSTWYPRDVTAKAPNTRASKTTVCVQRCPLPFRCTYNCPSGRNCRRTPAEANTVMFPVAGSVQYSGEIEPVRYGEPGRPVNAANGTMIVDPANGIVSQATGSFFADPSTKVQGRKLSWSLDPAKFPNYGLGPRAVFVWATYVTVDGNPVWAFVNNLAKTSRKSTTVVPPMQIVLGACAGESAND